MSVGYEPEGRVFESLRAHHKIQEATIYGDKLLA
jgi:hypothetical protein